MKNDFLKCSFNDVLYFNPYDNKYDLKEKGITVKDFDENLFIELEEYKKYKEELLNNLDPDEEKEKQFIVISSYSGNGKTTFIHWFKKEAEAKNFFFYIIQLIKKPSSVYSNNNLLSLVIADEILPLFAESKAIPFIIKNEEYFYKYFNSKIINNGDNLTIWDRILSFNDKIRNNTINNIFIHDFITDLEIQHSIEKRRNYILLLFFLENILNFREVKNKSYTFCFDNLDELNVEYLTGQVWDDLYNASEEINRICRDLPTIDFDFNLVKFVLIFREATLGLISSQLKDRLNPKYKIERIILAENAHLIFEKRFDFATDLKIIKENPSTHYQIISIIRKELFTKEFLLPMFNFDHRNLYSTIISIANSECSSSQDLKDFFTITQTQYNKISAFSKNGARGIIINGLVRYLCFNGFLTRFAFNPKKLDEIPQIGYCRSSRMVLTAFSNLSYPNGFPEDIYSLHRISPIEFSLSHSYKATRDIIDWYRLLYWLKEFFNPNEGSWAHFVSIHNKTFSDDGQIDFSEEEKLFKENRINDKRLSNISIIFNASAYIYLRIFIVHFEYFSCFECRKHRKPLFQSTDFNHKNGIYSFIEIIDSVFEKVEQFKKNNDQYLNEIIYKKLKWDLDRFSKSIFTFRKEHSEDNNLYMSRVISTHIEYLDSFRYYLWNNEQFKSDNVRSKERFPGLNILSLDEIQWYLISVIDKYLDIALDGQHTENMINIINKLKLKINKIHLKGLNEWISIDAK